MLMTQHKVKAILLEYLRTRKSVQNSFSTFSFGSSPSNSHLPDTLWLQAILVAELLSFFIDPSTSETEIYLAYLGDPEAHLRQVATDVLKAASPSIAISIADQALEMLLKEKNPFICRSIIILLGIYDRRDDIAVSLFVRSTDST